MANFEIKDCVQLRALAYKWAVREVGKDSLSIHDAADRIFNYIKGDADIPEYINPNAEMDGYLDVFREVSKNTAATNYMWFKPEQLLPPDNRYVLVACYNNEYQSQMETCFGKYEDNNWEAYPIGGPLSTKADNIKILAWCPIPEYKAQQYGRDILDSENRHDA